MLFQTQNKTLHTFHTVKYSFIFCRILLSANKCVESEKRVKISQLSLNQKYSLNCSWLLSVLFILNKCFSDPKVQFPVYNLHLLISSWKITFVYFDRKVTSGDCCLTGHSFHQQIPNKLKKKGAISFLFSLRYSTLVPLPSATGKIMDMFPLKNGLQCLKKWFKLMHLTSTDYEEIPDSFPKCKNLCNH